MGNSPRDCGPGGQWLGFIFIWWGIVLMGSCLRTPVTTRFEDDLKLELVLNYPFNWCH